MDKSLVSLTIFLMKDTVSDFKECLKKPYGLTFVEIKDQYKFDGLIVYCDSSQKKPKWKEYLDELSKGKIEIQDNSSNKALVLVRINDRIMAIAFGYGRSFLKEEHIERNFGFKVALNTIDPQKMRSVNASTIEDMVVNTQRQATYSTSQDEFGLNVTNDIMKGITGEPYDEKFGVNISGKDSLVVSVRMDLSELKSKLELYLSAYTDNRYKEIGFDWVDNIAEIRDSILSEELDWELCKAIEDKKVEHLHISPPETTDWSQVVGFCYSGCNKNTDDPDSYNLNLDLSDYIDKIKPDTNIFQKIRRDKLLGLTANGEPFVISNIYSSLVYQTLYNGKNYILCSGKWYQIDSSFLDVVNSFIKNQIKISDIELPDCDMVDDEGTYNEKAANSNPDYCLMDKKMISVLGGPKKIEACDIFTKSKQFIHVKNKSQSAQLSHLFAQGRVAAECFVSDENFRKEVFEKVKKELGTKVFDYKQKPRSNEYEIIYAIIDEKESELVDKLPFFSKVNLMLTAQDLDRMNFKYSVCLIKKA